MLRVFFIVVHALLIQTALCAYDYVIVGGGNGGLVVASRLSEDPNLNILVLEAGAEVEQLPEVYIPGMIGAGQAFTSLNWAYKTVPQTNMNDRNLTILAGKALGGSTIINSMIMTRATQAQYDAFGLLNNSTSWTWSRLLSYFRRSEIFTPPNPSQIASGASYNSTVHGPPFSTDPRKGSIKVGFPNFFFPQSEMFARALMNSQQSGLGFQRAVDLSDGDIKSHVGIPSNSLDAMNNTRCSAVCGYITPFINQRSNLQVITNATVSRIEWGLDRENGLLVAKRVEFFVGGDDVPQHADINVGIGGEVVLSAGTIGTPTIMERSGVGNASLLGNIGIDVKLDLPSVGENLADHIHSWANAVTSASVTRDVLRSNETFREEQLSLWEESRTGFYSAAPRTIGLAAASDILSKDRITQLLHEARLNMPIYASRFANGNDALAKGIMTQHQIALDLYEQDEQIPIEFNVEPGYAGPTPFENRGGKNYTTISAIFYSPLSRGRTHITSSNHTIRPSVDPAYWSHPVDVAMLTAGLQTARKILRTPPLDSIFVEEFEPGPNIETDEQAEAYLRTVAGSDNHEVGTMAMMPESLGGVVDTELRVYGIKNVRVADASVIPMPVSAHLESTVYAIGEKAADLIKQTRRLEARALMMGRQICEQVYTL